MTENPPDDSQPDSDALNLLAQKYLNLWVEHWAAAMAAPETAAVLARLFATPGMAQGGGLDFLSGWPGASLRPAPVRTAHDAGDGRVDELERRIAALERRLAERDAGPTTAKPAMGRPAGKSNRRTRAD
jgi:hypothetical protein